MTAFVGVDIGATNLNVLVADANGTILGRTDYETPKLADGAALENGLITAIGEACETAGMGPEAVAAAGVATVGPIDEGTICDPVNLPDVDNLDVAGAIADRFDCEVRLVNDATAGSIAEAAARGEDDLAYITLSTGIGVGVVADGRPLLGHRSNAGEVGHLTLDPDADLICGCGAPGHWEAFCGGVNLVDHARTLADDDLETDIDLDAAEPATLLEGVGDDPLATELADRVATWNAIGVASVVHAYDPARVVVGGGVALAHPGTVVDPIRDRLPDRCLHDAPPVETPRYGSDAPVRGGLKLARSGSRDRNR